MSIYLLHPAIVHFPIALLIGASVSALLYLHVRRRLELRILTWWLMFPGWVTLVLAIVSGIVAQGNLPPDAPYRSILNWHTGSGLALAALYADLLYRGWLHNSGQGRRKARRRGDDETRTAFLDAPGRKWLLTVQLLLGIALIVFSGWLGGQLVYGWGVQVGL